MVDLQGRDTSIEAVLGQLSQAATGRISPEEILTRAMDGLLQVARAPAGMASLATDDAKRLEVVSIRGIRPATAKTLPQIFHLEGRSADRLTRPIRLGKEGPPGLEGLHAWLDAEGIAGGIFVPLGGEGQLLGFLVAMFRAGAAPPRVPDSSLTTFQRQLSTALQHAKVRQSLQTLNMDLLRLLTLAKVLAEPLELEETLTMVAQAAKSFAGALATVIWLADPAAKQLTRIVSLEPAGPKRPLRATFAYGEGLPGWVAEHGHALYLDDALSDPRLVSGTWAESRGIRSIYAFPLRFKNTFVGVLSVGMGTPLSSRPLSLLETFCDHAALAIGHARLLRDKEVRAAQLGSLLAAAQAVTEGRGRALVLRLIAEGCRRALDAPWCSVWSAHGGSRRLRLLHADPPDRGVPARLRSLRYGSGFPGWTALHRKPLVTADAPAHALAGDADWYRRLGIRASLTLPLLAGKKLLGVLHLGARAALTEEQLRLFEGYGAVAAMALARPRSR